MYICILHRLFFSWVCNYWRNCDQIYLLKSNSSTALLHELLQRHTYLQPLWDEMLRLVTNIIPCLAEYELRNREVFVPSTFRLCHCGDRQHRSTLCCCSSWDFQHLMCSSDLYLHFHPTLHSVHPLDKLQWSRHIPGGSVVFLIVCTRGSGCIQ